MQPFDETLSDMVPALLADTERRDLPTLTREELHALGLPPSHEADLQWSQQLTERESALLGAAGTRSLAVRELVHALDDHLEPADELLVLACALTSPAWSVTLTAPDEVQLLLRGLPHVGACIISAYSDGIHAHTLATDDAAMREAATWLLDPSRGAHPRTVGVVSERHPAGLVARIEHDGAGATLHADDAQRDIDETALADWLTAATATAASD